MSWLSPTGGLFKSLENVLEKVDSTAANTLGKKEKEKETGQATSTSQRYSPSASKPNPLTSSPITKETPSKSATPAFTDEELFGFLNEPIKEAKQKREKEKEKEKERLAEKKVKVASSIPSIKEISPSTLNNTARENSNYPNIIDSSVENKEVANDSKEFNSSDVHVNNIPNNSNYNNNNNDNNNNNSTNENNNDTTNSTSTSSTTSDIKDTVATDFPVLHENKDENTFSSSSSSSSSAIQEQQDQLESPVTSMDEESVESSEYATLLNQYSDLQLENKLLRSKIRTMNQEITNVTARYKAATSEVDRISANARDMQHSILEKDKLISKMKKIEEEFDSAIGQKNTQIAHLQVKLEEAFQDIKSRDEKINSLSQKYENSSSKKESTIQSHLQTIAVLNTKIQELEQLLEKDKSDYKLSSLKIKQISEDYENKLSDLTRALSSAQRSLEEKSYDVTRLNTSLKDTQEALKNTKQEMNEYKLRATKVLHEKDSLISQLTASLNSLDSPSSSLNPSNTSQQQQQPSIGIVKISSIEYNNIIHERESMNKELEEYKDQLIKMEQSLGESQVEFTNERTRLLNQLKELEEVVDKEKKKFQAMQMQNMNLSNELMNCKEDYEKQIADLLISLKSKDDDIIKLKKQSNTRSSNLNSQSTPSIQEELENRIKSITENLIQKQNQLESLLSEKAYLQLQIENLHQQLQNSKRTNKEDNHFIDDVDDYDQEYGLQSISKTRKRSGGPGNVRLRSIASLVESTYKTSLSREPEDSLIGRRVVGAAHLLDSLSTITGTYLRHYPLFRVSAIFYLGVLHLWILYVFFSLNTCIPEVHPK